jgi:hypothetical protein
MRRGADVHRMETTLPMRLARGVVMVARWALVVIAAVVWITVVPVIDLVVSAIGSRRRSVADTQPGTPARALSRAA